MQAYRLAVMAAGLTLPLVVANAPAQAQVDDAIVLEIMRQCARIDDATARLACFDNNIRPSSGAPARATVPGQSPAPLGTADAPVRGSAVRGFGSEDVRQPDRFNAPAGELEELTTSVTSVNELQPGIYRLTLADGAQWQFAESVPNAYRPPRQGSQVTIDRGALGSFLLSFDNQAAVRVRRIR